MKRILLVSFFILSAASIYAQEFVATVNNNEVGENERFQVTFKFSGESLKKLSNYDPPSFNNFQILSGPNQSTSMQIINGEMSASISYSYILIPTTRGSFSIGSAKIDYEGETYSTKPVKINVVKGTSTPKKNNDTEVSNKEIAENLFIRAFADKKQVYLGEQVTVTYKLYTRLSIAAQMSVNKLPKYQGFWAEEIETSNNITFNTEVINGKQFRVGVLKRVALFPSQTGELEITPFELTVPIQLKRERNPNNLFDSFFGDPFGRGKTIEFDARSNVLKLNVKKLPEENKPDSYKGAVGDYSFTASMDSTVTQTNQPVTLTLKISGKGNIKLVEFPEFELPAGFEKYDPKIDENIIRRGNVSGVKTAEYLLVPRVAGKRTIEPIEFSFFNPLTEKYRTLRSSTFNINIKQGSESNDDYYAKENVDLLDEDIRFIKTSFDDLNKKGELLLFQPFFLIAMALPLFLFIGAVSYKRKQDKLAGDVRTLRYRKAEKVAKKRFRFAKMLMQDGKSSEFYSEISLALFGYLEDKFSIPKADFTLQKAAEELRKNNVDENIIHEMLKLAEQCEFIRFAPGGEDKASMQQMYDDLSRVVIEIEKSIN